MRVYWMVGLEGKGTAVRKPFGGGDMAAGTAHCLVASTEKRSEDFVHPKVSLPQERSTVRWKRAACLSQRPFDNLLYC